MSDEATPEQMQKNSPQAFELTDLTSFTGHIDSARAEKPRDVTIL
jgi:hypothetical protein